LAILAKQVNIKLSLVVFPHMVLLSFEPIYKQRQIGSEVKSRYGHESDKKEKVRSGADPKLSNVRTCVGLKLVPSQKFMNAFGGSIKKPDIKNSNHR
jgi:hypothetical protein